MGPAPADDGSGPEILLAEHDHAVACMLARYLERDGLAVRLAATPALALAGLGDGRASVAVLDLTMPELDPRRVRQALRIPVTFLVAPGPRPGGLGGGTTRVRSTRRWLTRPFGPRLLVATVRELLRDASQRLEPPGDPAPVARGACGIVLDDGRRTAVLGERDIPLTGAEFGILAALLAVPGRARSRRQLLAAAGRKADDRAADVYVAQLRAKIGLPRLIRTVRGTGYVIDEPVFCVGAELGAHPDVRGQ